MSNTLDAIELPYVDSQTLRTLLKNYSNPHDWISRRVRNGELIRLKRGFFLIASKFHRGERDCPFEQISNILYGPYLVSRPRKFKFIYK